MDYKVLNNFREWFEQSYKWTDIQWQAFSNLTKDKNYTFYQLKDAVFDCVTDSNFKPTPADIMNNIKVVKQECEPNVDIENIKLDKEFRDKFKKTDSTHTNADILFNKNYEECSQLQKALLYTIERYDLNIFEIIKEINKRKTPIIAISIVMKNKFS